MDVDQRAEIRDEFHSTGQAVVESRLAGCGDLDPLGPQRQGGAAGPPARAGEAEAAFGAQAARGFDHAGEEGAAADEARNEPIGRPLVEVALAADLVDGALV